MENELKPKIKGEAMKNDGEMADIAKNRYLAALSYIWILCLVPLFLKRDSKFAQFHAKQGLVLFIANVAGSLVFWIPVVGWLLGLGILILAVLGIVKALSGQWWEMPYLGKYAKKLNI